MERDVKCFFRDRVGCEGETVTGPVPSSRCDSSPVISKPLIIRILNRFWIGQLNTTTGLKPQREWSYLMTFASFLRSSMKLRNSRWRVSSSGARSIEEGWTVAMT